MTNKILEYKGFQGSIEFSIENDILYGKILHIHDLVTFEASTPKELEAAFQESVDDYLLTCSELGVEPNKPLSGTFNIRIGCILHQGLAKESAREGKSINDIVKEAVDCHLNGRHQEIHHHYPSAGSAYEAGVVITSRPKSSPVQLRIVH